MPRLIKEGNEKQRDHTDSSAGPGQTEDADYRVTPHQHLPYGKKEEGCVQKRVDDTNVGRGKVETHGEEGNHIPNEERP
jgi:hypothetical protein